MNEQRAFALVQSAIRTFGLDLTGLNVLTEAATGCFIFTPLIAAIAGAKKVYALTCDSRYGPKETVIEQTMRLARAWNVSDRLIILTSREDQEINNADIVTNLGFIRPLDKQFLGRLKLGVVIPLMWETWEFRHEDIDLMECHRKEIPVLGTNEHHSNLQTFRYVGLVALKQLLLLEVEIFRSTIIVIGDGEFADEVVTVLGAAGAHVDRLSPSQESILSQSTMSQRFSKADAVVVVEHHDRKMLIGPGGLVSVNDLRVVNPGLVIAHICGTVDEGELKRGALRIFPETLAPAGYMSVTTAFVGPKPAIDLHTAGLKVGEAMARATALGLRGLEAEMMALKICEYAQGFPNRHPTG